MTSDRFLQACIKESLRIFSPVPMGLPRIAPEGGLTIGDRTLPEGTIVSINPWVMHHSKEIWGKDAHEFNPDRWLGGGAAAREKYWISVSKFSIHVTPGKHANPVG
jgi:cytochrome P450